MTGTEYLAAQNAAFNASATVFLLLGYRAIRGKDRVTHRRMMLSALTCSALFLVGYLARVIAYGPKSFGDHGLWTPFYHVLLGTHTMLAVTVPFFALYALFLATKERFVEHRRIAKIALPIWLYVSVTGVLVYLMLFQLFV